MDLPLAWSMTRAVPSNLPWMFKPRKLVLKLETDPARSMIKFYTFTSTSNVALNFMEHRTTVHKQISSGEDNNVYVPLPIQGFDLDVAVASFVII